MPQISVIMPCFNHAPYIGMAVASVLGQTIPDIELIVIDDGSTDGTQQILNSIKDDRLRCVLRKQNIGAAQGSNEGINMARSPYIAMISSDDFFFPTKLERQLELLTSRECVTAVFCRPEITDESGKPYPAGKHRLQKEFLSGVWDQPTLIRRLSQGNFLCHPSILTRREVYELLGPYDVRLYSLGDFDMWMRMAVTCSGDVIVANEPLMAFRCHATSTSGITPENIRCGQAEWPLIFGRLFALREHPDVLIKAFPEAAPLFHGDPEDIDYALCRMALNHHVESVRAFGLQGLYLQMGRKATATRLARVQGFTPRDLIKLTQQTDLGLFAGKNKPQRYSRHQSHKVRRLVSWGKRLLGNLCAALKLIK